MKNKDSITIKNGEFTNPDKPEKPQITKKKRQWPYIIITLIFTGLTLFILYFLLLDIHESADKSVKPSIKQHSVENGYNKAYDRLLKELKSGADPSEVAGKLRRLQYKYSSLIADSVEVFGVLKKHVTEENRDKLEYRNLKKNEIKKLNSILGELRSFGKLDKDSLYLAFVARDLMFYIFNNRDVFLIHIDDILLWPDKRKEMIAFYEDVFAIYDYLKELYKNKYPQEKFYNDAVNFDLLAIGLYSKAVDATSWFNDKNKIQEIITSANQKFNLAGERGRWYSWLQNDLIKVNKNLTLRWKIQERPPSFVGGYWFK